MTSPLGSGNNMSSATLLESYDDGEARSDLPSRTELYIVMGLLTFLAIMGTAGNALVLYVFSKKKDRLTSTLFILGLAFVDFTTCLIVIPYTIYIEFVDFHIRYDILCKIYQFLITCNIPFSALIMVAIAIDRYFCICHPFLHAMNLRRAKLMIGCLGMMAVAIGVIVGLMYGVYQKVPAPVDPPTNVTLPYNVSQGLGAGGGELSDVERARSLIFNPQSENIQVLKLYTGHCAQNEFVLSSDFAWYFQKCYTAMYLVCLIIVIILYVLIYRSVLARRTKRQKAKSKALPLTITSGNDNNGNSQEETLLTTVNGDAATTTTTVIMSAGGTTPPPGTGGGEGGGGGNTPTTTPTGTNTAITPGEVRNGSSSKITHSEKSSKKKKDDDEEKKRKSTRKDRNRIANLKTAAMLFVVTVVFIVTFLPAFLMALQLIPYSMTVFYMYFANNVANPVIYSFMNKNFRDDLKKLFCRR